jgi:Fe-S-cluster containining protein
VGRLNATPQIIKEVDIIYRWLDEQLSQIEQSCQACGNCCDFESFGHRLYVTTPELINFQHYLGPEIKQMTDGICPYRIDGKCTVYPYRFSGCRIFSCKGDAEKENEICEKAIKKFKSLCDQHDIPYRYVYLRQGLEKLNTNLKS